MSHPLARLLFVVSLLSVPQGSPGPRIEPADWPSNRWREWFLHRQFGLDPWAYLSSASRTATPCPADQKLSIATVDSGGVRLQLIDDRRRPIVVVAECVIPYDRFRGQPAHGQLPDGRVLWKLQVADTSRSRQ